MLRNQQLQPQEGQGHVAAGRTPAVAAADRGAVEVRRPDRGRAGAGPGTNPKRSRQDTPLQETPATVAGTITAAAGTTSRGRDASAIPRTTRCCHERTTRIIRQRAVRRAAAGSGALSFTFCKRHGVLVQTIGSRLYAEAVYRPGAQPAAIAEVRRVLGMPLQLRRVDAEAFDQLLRQQYEGGTNAACRWSAACEDDTDLAHLAQDLPEAFRLAGKRRSGADHQADQRHPDAGGQGQRVRYSHRAVREPPGRALPRRRRIARSPAIEARGRAAGRIAHQGHVEARHRRETLAAGRPHFTARRRPRGRRSRLDDSRRSRRTRRVAFAGQAGRSPGIECAGHGPAHAEAHRRADPQASRHHSGHRPDRFRQDDDAVLRARAHQRQHPQHSHRRRSHRVLHRRHRPDAGEHEGRDDLRARPARHPAPGPGRGDDRRNPRPRDGAHRRAGIADRSLGVVDLAHEHRCRRRHASA